MLSGTNPRNCERHHADMAHNRIYAASDVRYVTCSTHDFALQRHAAATDQFSARPAKIRPPSQCLRCMRQPRRRECGGASLRRRFAPTNRNVWVFDFKRYVGLVERVVGDAWGTMRVPGDVLGFGAMELNQIKRFIKDLEERADSLRRYL
jgi:hypothetical protein